MNRLLTSSNASSSMPRGLTWRLPDQRSACQISGPRRAVSAFQSAPVSAISSPAWMRPVGWYWFAGAHFSHASTHACTMT